MTEGKVTAVSRLTMAALTAAWYEAPDVREAYTVGSFVISSHLTADGCLDSR